MEEIDISLCKEIGEEAVLSFLKDAKKIRMFHADHMEHTITDAVM